MNFTTMHRIEMCTHKQTDRRGILKQTTERKRQKKTERTTDWIEEVIESRKQTAIGIMISRTNKNMNAQAHKHKIEYTSIRIRIYLLSYFIKTVLLLLWIENCHRPTDILRYMYTTINREREGDRLKWRSTFQNICSNVELWMQRQTWITAITQFGAST